MTPTKMALLSFRFLPDDAPVDIKVMWRGRIIWYRNVFNTDGSSLETAVALAHTQNTDTGLGTLGTKNPPIDADLAIYRNSASSNALVTSTWTQIKAFLKTYWDTLYEAIGAAASAVATHAALTTGVHGVGAGTVSIKNADTLIKDTDSDTKIQTEEAADEDIIRMDVAGVESLKISSIGVLTLAKQSYVAVKSSIGQTIPTGGVPVIIFETEDEDRQNEFDSSVKTGTASATSANHLVDATLSPFVAGDVGKKVWNTTDNTYTYITVFNSTSDVTVANDIFILGEGYKVYFSKFTATENGAYFVNASVQPNGNLGDGNYFEVNIYKNGATRVATGLIYGSGAAQWEAMPAISIIPLVAGDYLQVRVNQNIGTVPVSTDSTAVYFRICKIL